MATGRSRNTRSRQPISRGALARFLERPSLETHLQPIYHLGTGHLLGFEALSRFPGGGGALEWIRAAHRFRLIEPFDRVLFHSAMRTFADSELPGAVFVNLEARHLDRVTSWLGEMPVAVARPLVSRRRLVLEVTEREPEPPLGWRAASHEVREHGPLLALDDFLCNLRFLRNVRELRPEYVKLDGKVARALAAASDEGARRIDGWLEAARSSGAVLIGEGIEDPGHARALRAHGVMFGQGFELGRPARASAWRIDRTRAASAG